ncbi:Decaprenyl-phosphate phosphoribosyltransferase [Candidatus Thermoflexus japonica]|uniref:Decaprenyl-phosphate phosphoribosyltransferase n=1 Tax=Candidatus Thermoflexus japonica TaxID=2035417 RepID=A0A2H5Y9U0_9CHLR|nr:Decaprenyl-phosphate phosphoribosyltransferase [Candidatus Thermoflexus japonica]
MKAIAIHPGKAMIGLVQSMRPRQWLKNVFIFAPLVFDEKLLRPEPLGRTVAGFAILCLLSGAVYLFNDLQDLERDRQHPRKRHRPLPAGELDPRIAWGAALLIPIGLAYPSFTLDPWFALIAYVYWGMNLAYSLWLKHRVILDVLTLASGYVLRVAAGVPLVHVERFSPWLYLCTLLLALFIGFAKRRQEIILLGENARNHRAILEEYTVRFLDEMMGVVMAATIVAYSLYTFSAPNLPSNHAMMLTIPFVLYGIFRYLYLIHVKGETAPPDELVLKDRPLLLTVLLWGLTAILILYLL